jgi:hypothetical protein
MSNFITEQELKDRVMLALDSAKQETDIKMILPVTAQFEYAFANYDYANELLDSAQFNSEEDAETFTDILNNLADDRFISVEVNSGHAGEAHLFGGIVDVYSFLRDIEKAVDGQIFDEDSATILYKVTDVEVDIY